MVLYIVRNHLLGTATMVEASTAYAAAASMNLPDRFEVEHPAMGTAHVYVLTVNGQRATRPYVTASVASGTRENRAEFTEMLARTGGVFIAEVWWFSDESLRPTYQGLVGVTDQGQTATYHGDRDYIIGRIRRDVEEGHVGPLYASRGA